MSADVAILGAGPAGLIVAHAVEQAGHVPRIYSRPFKSELPGSLHIRKPIPGLTSDYPDATVHIMRMGYAEDYAHKVYGSPEHVSGWANYFSIEGSWNAQRIYDRLWEHFHEWISGWELDDDELFAIVSDHDLVISTLPQNLLCRVGHAFRGTPYWIKSLPTPEEDATREVIIYNGLPEDHWYRYSILGGKTAIESTRRMEGANEGIKVLDTDCDCNRSIVRAGRWAAWRHGVLLHDAYHTAVKAMEEWL